MTRPPLLADSAVQEWIASHSPWALVEGHLIGRFELSYDRAIAVLQLTEPEIHALNHHPVATVRYGSLTVDMFTDDQRGITELDLKIAERFSIAVDQYAAK